MVLMGILTKLLEQLLPELSLQMHLKLLVGQLPRIVLLLHRGQQQLEKVCRIMIIHLVLDLGHQYPGPLKALLQSIWNLFNRFEKRYFLKMVGEEIM